LKHIILAAGKGTRMKHHTMNLAKGMLRIGGISIIERQINTIKKIDTPKIIIVRGYRAQDINFPYIENIRYYTNEDYANTNMVASLMKARSEFTEDISVSYGDILYNYEMLRDILTFPDDFVVAVDVKWKKYWKMRYDQIEHDTESLKIGKEGNIIQLGTSNPPIEEIDARYIGLLKFSRKALSIMEDIYDSNERWKTAYMTDMLQEVIDRGYPVFAVPFENGWIEFDTAEDYKKNTNWFNNESLLRQLNLKL